MQVGRLQGYRPVGAGQAGMGGSFDIPAAPILIPAGPWQEIEGGILAPKGFKAQGFASIPKNADQRPL